LLWRGIVAVGVVRCASTVDDRGNPPSPESLTLEAAQMSQDRADLERVIRCDWGNVPGAMRVNFLRWTPFGPRGGCVGGEWQVRLLYDVCACS
jgi:hypothetical protein